MKRRKLTDYKTDERRKHHHFVVTLFYADGEKFSRTHTDPEKPKKFAQRQKKSPLMERTRVSEIDQ
jgi:hypothetical protein